MLICKITRKESMPTVPFQKIAEACKTTGLSRYFLRQGCKNGTVPHIKSITSMFRRLWKNWAKKRGYDLMLENIAHRAVRGKEECL